MNHEGKNEPGPGVKLGILEYQEAKRIKAVLMDRGITLTLVSNPETCSSGGCAPTVELHGNEEDLPRITEFFREEKDRGFGGLEVDHGLLEEVFDPEKEDARCPACGTVFKTTSSECPDCGLVFSGP